MATLAERRTTAIEGTIERIREIEASGDLDRDRLEQIRQAMLALVEQRELFPRATFVTRGDTPQGRIYRLWEDPGHGLALYLNCGNPGTTTPPHNHTTWAVIAGLDGEEHQKIYRRTDDGSVPGKGSVEVDREFTVEPGTAIAFMPDDIHSIHVEGTAPIMHLHMYGRAFEAMQERVAYDTEAGTYKVFPGHPDVMNDPGDD